MVEEIQVRPPPLFGAAAGAGWTRAGRRPGYGQARPGQGEGHKSVHVGYKLDLATNRAGDGERGMGGSCKTCHDFNVTICARAFFLWR